MKSRKIVIISAISLILLITITIFAADKYSQCNQYYANTDQEIIEKYISVIRNSNDDRIWQGQIYSHDCGMAEDQSLLPAMSLEEAEANGIINKIKTAIEKIEFHKQTALFQKALVEHEFGSDAWDNISFSTRKSCKLSPADIF